MCWQRVYEHIRRLFFFFSFLILILNVLSPLKRLHKISLSFTFNVDRNRCTFPYQAKDGRGLSGIPNSFRNVLICEFCLADLAAQIDTFQNQQSRYIEGGVHM